MRIRGKHVLSSPVEEQKIWEGRESGYGNIMNSNRSGRVEGGTRRRQERGEMGQEDWMDMGAGRVGD